MEDQNDQTPQEEPKKAKRKPRPRKELEVGEGRQQLPGELSTTEIELLRKVRKDLQKSVELMPRKEAQYLVSLYYTAQGFRIDAGGKERAAFAEAVPGPEPTTFIGFIVDSMKTIEENIRKALQQYSKLWTVGIWMNSICGIGPVISAGFLSKLDVRRSKTAGGFHRLVGYDPTLVWKRKEVVEDELLDFLNKERAETYQQLLAAGDQLEALKNLKAADKVSVHDVLRYAGKHLGGRQLSLFENAKGNPLDEHKRLSIESAARVLAKRPWSAELKVLCWKLGESFVKQQNRDNDYYGALYRRRKEYEEEKNARGEYKEQAEKTLKERGRMLTDNQKIYYRDGLLPPGRIELRARRWAVKIFLSHLHHVMHEDMYDVPPPVPYIFSKAGTTHQHFIPIPNWPMKEAKGRSLKELLTD